MFFHIRDLKYLWPVRTRSGVESLYQPEPQGTPRSAAPARGLDRTLDSVSQPVNVNRPFLGNLRWPRTISASFTKAYRGEAVEHANDETAGRLTPACQGPDEMNEGTAGKRQERAPEEDIAYACELALGQSPDSVHKNVHALVSGGRVTLYGTVERGTERWTAEDAVSRLAGVTAVNSQVTVKKPARESRSAQW